MLKFFKTLFKVIFGTIGTIIGLAITLFIVANLAKFLIYDDYYKIESNICVNPGLDDGFVCQGVCVSEERGKILISGYMDDQSNSRIYVVDIKTDSYYYVKLERSGKLYRGHAGGIATSGNNVYLSSGAKLYLLQLSDLLVANNGDTIDMGTGVPVNNAADYVYCDESYIYVGEFHHTKGGYEKEHNYDSKEGMHHAIVSKYSHESILNFDGKNVPTPEKIYSIREKVQGVCFTPDGKVVLSTSYSIDHSYFYVYNEADARDSGETLDGAPVYILEDCTKEIKAPAMSEDLDYYNGLVITVYENASNKYFYGKLFFANEVNGLDIK